MSKRKRIAVDFDEVLFPFIANFVDHYNDKHGTDHHMDDFVDYTVDKVLGLSMEQSIEHIFDFFFNTDSHIHEPIEEAKDHVNEIGRHHDLFIVTARQFELEDLTNEWINKHFPNAFKNILLCNSFGPKEPMLKKADVCKEIGAELLIDDALHNAISCANNGIDVFLYDGGYVWNKTDELPENITRVHSWREIRDKLI